MANVTAPMLLDSTGQDMVTALNAIAGLTPSRADALAADFAQVESSSTSAHAYSVGDYLMLNDQLYKVTQAIAIGDTITSGTNVTATSVTDELGGGGGASSLDDLSDVTISTPSSGQVLKYDGSKWENAADNTPGHTVENSSGTGMTQRANLQFANCSVTDDSVNNRTVVMPSNILTTTVDPGEGSALAENCFLFVVEA